MDKIEEELNKNNPICDLSEIELNEETTNLILKTLKENPNVGLIKFKESSNNEFKSKIEAQLIQHNNEYRAFPTDHVHCLLSSHCYETSFEKDFSEYKFKEEIYTFLNEQGWKIRDIFMEEKYKSVLYINNRTCNLVLAFQGIKLKVSDFFLKDSQINTIINSMLSNEDVARESAYSCLHTQSAVNLCKEKKYSLSFTGYGFGAWLAEQAVYYASQDFGFANARAVTFDSPGSLDYLEKLSETNTNKKFDFASLDIVTYLSAPNFLNTCNRHIQKIYRVYNTKSNNFSDADSVFKSISEENSDKKLKKRIKEWFEKKLKPIKDRCKFYINGLKSMLSNGIHLFLKEFDLKSGKPFKFKLVEKWPRIEFTPSKDFKNNFSNIFDFQNIIDSIPIISFIPSSIRSLAAGILNKVGKTVFNAVADNFLSGISGIINFIIEIKNGNLNDDQCLKLFEFDYDKEDFEINDEDDPIKKVEKNFLLSYQAHYKVTGVCFKYDTMSIYDEKSIDQLLYNLSYYTENENDFNGLKSSFIEKQLQTLKCLFKFNGNKIDVVEDGIEIELIIFRLKRLLMIHDQIEDFLYKLKFKKSKASDNQIQLVSSYKEPNLYFFGRTKELEEIRNKLKYKQHVFICGICGCGKSEVALNLALDFQKESKDHLFIWIEANSLLQRFRQLAEDLGVKTIDNMEPIEFFQIVKNQLNKYIYKEPKISILFVIDDLIDQQNHEKNYFGYLRFGFDSNVKFLITTKDSTIIEQYTHQFDRKFQIFELELLDLKEIAIDYTKIVLNERFGKFKEAEWNQIFDEMTAAGNGIIDLEKLLSAIKEDECWELTDLNDLKDVIDHIKRETQKPYAKLKKVNKNAFDILSYFAYLDGSSINLKMIELLLIKNKSNNQNKKEIKSKLKENLKYLRKISEIKKHDSLYIIHKQTQKKVLQIFQSKKRGKEESKKISEIVDALNSLIDQDEINKETTQMDDNLNEYLNHSEKILKFEWLNKNESENCVDLYSKIGKIYENKLLRYETAESYYQKSLSIQNNIPGGDQLKLAYNYRSIGRVQYIQSKQVNRAYLGTNSLEKALKYSKEALQILLTINDTKYRRDIAKTHQNIGLILHEQKEYKVSLDHFENALIIYDDLKKTEECRQEIIALHNNMGLNLADQGNYVEALKWYEKSLDIAKIVYTDDDHSEIATLYNNIGLLLFKQEKYDNALDQYNKSLAIFTKVYNTEFHPSVANVYNNIGLHLFKQKKYDEALEKYKQSLYVYNYINKDGPDADKVSKNIKLLLVKDYNSLEALLQNRDNNGLLSVVLKGTWWGRSLYKNCKDDKEYRQAVHRDICND